MHTSTSTREALRVLLTLAQSQAAITTALVARLTRVMAERDALEGEVAGLREGLLAKILTEAPRIA